MRSPSNAKAFRRDLKRFQAKHALGLDPGMEAGSRRENASNQESRVPFRFYRNGTLARVPEGFRPQVRISSVAHNRVTAKPRVKIKKIRFCVCCSAAATSQKPGISLNIRRWMKPSAM